MRSYLVEYKKPMVYSFIKGLAPFLLFYLCQQMILRLSPEHSFSVLSVLLKASLLFLISSLVTVGISFIIPLKLAHLTDMIGMISFPFMFFYFNTRLHYQWIDFNECIGLIILLCSFIVTYFAIHTFEALKNL